MIKILLLSISLIFPTLSNSAQPAITTQIVALQGEIDSVDKVNLLRFFNDSDDIADKPTTMKFSLTGNPGWISIDGVDLKISPSQAQSKTNTTIKIIADDGNNSIYQSVKVFVPNQKSINQNFPLMGVPYIYSGEYVTHDGINNNNPIVESRKNFQAHGIDCSALMAQIPSVAEIRSGNYDKLASNNEYNKYMFPKTGYQPSETVPWDYITEDNNYPELFDSKDATDAYKKIIQQNQVCEIRVNVESGRRIKDVYSETYTENSPDKVDQLIGEKMTAVLSNYADRIEAKVDNITHGGYGDSADTVRTVSEAIALYHGEFENFSSLMCAIYNGDAQTEIDLFQKSSTYAEATAFFESEISRVKGIAAAEITITAEEKDLWDRTCIKIPNPIPRAHPQGRGVESAKALYSLGYRNVPQTKKDGEYDMGIQNMDFDRGYQKTTHFASVKKGSNPYMSSGIQNGPSRFQYEDNPGGLESVVYDLVYDDMRRHKDFNTYVGNKSSYPEMKGMVMMPTTGSFDSGSIGVSGLGKFVNSSELLIANNSAIVNVVPSLSPGSIKKEDAAASGWAGNIEMDRFLAQDYREYAPTILDLYEEGFNVDGGACDKAGDTLCKFAFSLYLTDGGNAGIHFLPVPHIRDGQAFGGSPLTKAEKQNPSKEFFNNGDVKSEINYLDLDPGNETALTRFTQTNVDVYSDVVVLEIDPDGNEHTTIEQQKTGTKIVDPQYTADLYYSLTYDDMKAQKFDYDLNGFAVLLKPSYFTGANSNYGIILKPNKNIFSPSYQDIFLELDVIINEKKIINPAYEPEVATPVEEIKITTKIDGWDDSDLVKNFLTSGSVGISATILNLYEKGYNWDGGKCQQSGDSSCIFAFSLYLNDVDGGMYLKPVPVTSGGGHSASFTTIGSPLIKENQLDTTRETKDSGSRMNDIPNGYLGVGDQGSSLSYLNNGAIKSDYYYSLTYDQMYNGNFGYELDGLAILLPPGYFYSGESKRLNTYSFLQLKTPRYNRVDAGYDAYVFADSGNDLLNSTNNSGKILISQPRVTPSKGYCSGLGLGYEDGYCVGEPCSANGLNFNETAGICEESSSSFSINDKDSMCTEPPKFKPMGVEELSASISSTVANQGSRLHQTELDGGYCKTIIPVKRLPASCKEIKDASPLSADGEYYIFLAEKKTKVYCDMETDNGGWTLAIRDPDGLVPSPCAWCHADNVWPGGDLVNPDKPKGDLINKKWSKGPWQKVKNPYKGLPFYTMKPTSVLFKAYINSKTTAPTHHPSKNQIFSGARLDSNNILIPYQTLSQAPAPTKNNAGALLIDNSVTTYEYRGGGSHHWYSEELYVRDDGLPIRIKEIMNTPDRWAAFTRNKLLPDPRDAGDSEYYHYDRMPKANFPYLTTALEVGENSRASGKYALLVEAMDRIDTNWSGDPSSHAGRNIRVKVVISEPGNYKYKYAVIHQSDSTDQSCMKKPSIEIKTQTTTYRKSLCIRDVSPNTTEWKEDYFRTTKVNEEIIIDVLAVAEHKGDWSGTRFVVPFDQDDINFNNISTSSFNAQNLCGPGYSLTADLDACQHTSYKECPSSNTQLITNNGVTTCGKLPDNCSISELELITNEVEIDGKRILEHKYGSCKFPAFSDTSIDVIKNISSRIFYNKFIKENNGLITPADLDGLEISSDYKDTLIDFEKTLNEKGESIWDMDSDSGTYPNLNRALALSSDYIDSSDLKKMTDSYDIDNASRKRFVKSVGLLKENLPEFAIDSMAVTYGIMARRLRDLPGQFGTKITCVPGEMESYDSDYERVCINTQSGVSDISRYRWDPIEQGQDADFKLEINGDDAVLMVESTKSVVINLRNAIPISSKILADLILVEMNKDINGGGGSLIRSVINCKDYKVNVGASAITKVSDANTNGEGVIYGSLNCKLPDLSYSNVAISNFKNAVETDESSMLEDLDVVADLGIMERNRQLDSCKIDIGNNDRFGSYGFTTWRDGVSKQEYEKRGNFNSEISLHIPKKLTTAYIKERETNAAAVEQIKGIIGTVIHDELGRLNTSEDGLVVFDGKSGIFADFLTDEGSSYIANKVNDAIQGAFPYRSKNIPMLVSTDMFSDSMQLNKDSVSTISSFTFAIDDKYKDDLNPLSTIFMPGDGYVGVRNDIVSGNSVVAEYKAEIFDDVDEKKISINIPGFKKALDKTLTGEDSLLDRLSAVFPSECSHLKVDGYESNLIATISKEYSEQDEYVSTSKSEPEYENISKFIFGPKEKKNYVYVDDYGREITILREIHLDEEIQFDFNFSLKFLNHITPDAKVWSINEDGSNPKAIDNYFDIKNIESPTQQVVTCKVDIDSICNAGDIIPNEEIGNYYYSSAYLFLALEGGISFVSGETTTRVKSGDKWKVKKGGYLDMRIKNPYIYMDQFIVKGTSKLLIGMSEDPSSINNPQYESLYYKNTYEKFGDIEDLYFSRFNGGELSLSVDISKYEELGISEEGTEIRDKCDMVYGVPSAHADEENQTVDYRPSMSASINDEMVVDYQRVDISKTISQEIDTFSDSQIISSPNILSQLKCTNRGLRVSGSKISCNSKFEEALKFSKFEIRNIFNGNVILDAIAQEKNENDEINATHTSLVGLHRGDNLENINFELNTKIELISITEEYTTSGSSSVYNVAADNILSLIVEVLKYNPDYRLYIKPSAFDKSKTGNPINFNMVLNADVTNISREMEISINVANNACLSVSNFDQSIIDEMKEKNKFYMVLKSMLDVNDVTAQLEMPNIHDLGDKIKKGQRTQSYKFLKGWGSPSQGDIRKYYRSTVSAETALIQDISSKCGNNSMYLADAMEAGVQAADRSGLFCKLVKDFLFEPAGDKYVFEPKDTEDIGVKIELPAYKNFDFGGADGFNDSRLTGLINNQEMYEEQGINFWKKTHHFVLNSRDNLFTQIMKGIALHEFEYQKQMAGIVNIDFLNDCTTGLSEGGVYKANIKDLSLKRAFSDSDGIKTLIPAVISLDGIGDYNNYNPIKSTVETDEIAAGYAVASQGNGHAENNSVKLSRFDSNSGLDGAEAIGFCQNIITPMVLVGNDYLDAGNLEVLAGASSRGSAIINIKVPRSMVNDIDQNMYRDLLGNPNWFQDKVCRDGYEEVGVRLHKKILQDNPDLCDGGLNSGHCAQGGPPSFGFIDAIMAIFGSNKIEREMNEYNNNGLMKIVEICGVGSGTTGSVDYAIPGDDTTKKKIVIFTDGVPQTVLEGNVLLEKGGVDKVKLNMQVLYSDSGCTGTDQECNGLEQNKRTLVINSINLFNTITNKKTGQDRSIGVKGFSGEGDLSLDTGSPIENLINSCMKFKSKVSYRKAYSGAGFELDSSSTDKSGTCSIQPRKNLDRLSCNTVKGEWTSRIPLLKSYTNAKKDFSFVDPRNGQQRSVRDCSDIFVENEDVFSSETDAEDMDKIKREEMVRQFENSITGCSDSVNINTEEDAKEEADKVRAKKMKDLVMTCGIEVRVGANPDASALLAKELSSFESAGAGSYGDQSEDGVFRTKVGRDKGDSLGALKNKNFKEGDFSKTPTRNSSADDMIQKNLDKLDSANAAADPMSGFNSGLTALSSILDTISMIPGVGISSGMANSVKKAGQAMQAVSIVKAVDQIKKNKDMIGGGAAVKAANEIQNLSFEDDKKKLAEAKMGIENMSVGEYVDDVINFDKSMKDHVDEQDLYKSIEDDRYERMKTEYRSKEKEANDLLDRQGGGALRTDLESKATGFGDKKYLHETIKVNEFSDTYYTRESAEKNFYSGDVVDKHYDDMDKGSSIQKDYYLMQSEEYQNKLSPGAFSQFKDKNTVEDRNISNAYDKFGNISGDDNTSDYLKRQSDEYKQYQLNQTGVIIEGFSR